MCGIFCLVTLNCSQVPSRINERIKKHIIELVRRRGPDGCGRNVVVANVNVREEERDIAKDVTHAEQGRTVRSSLQRLTTTNRLN
jgi:asparagine synthetase B (glutamine-hydrolysing)